MVKGSNGSKMTPIVKALQRKFAPRDATGCSAGLIAECFIGFPIIPTRFQFFNLFRYITWRTGGAMMTAAMFMFIAGSPIIDWLRAAQGKGQPIRADGPQSHLKSKIGTPTMGGLMIIFAVTVSTILWANPATPMCGSCSASRSRSA